MHTRLLLVAALVLTGTGTTVEGALPAPALVRAPSPAAASAGTPDDPQTSVQQADLIVPTVDEARDAAEPTAAPDAAAPADEPSANPSTASPDAVVDPSDQPVVADQVSEADNTRVMTSPVEATDAQTIGVTWPEGTDGAALEPQARTLSDGVWSEWVELESEDAVPDPGTADAAAASRGGTGSFWIGDAEAVQLSFAAPEIDSPEGLDLVLVGSEEIEPTTAVRGDTGAQNTASSTEAVFSAAVATQETAASIVTAAATQPTVISRAQWGAQAQVCAPDVAGSLVGAVVHHTAGSNSYTTVAQAMRQIRNDQAYHISRRGWCDIGYNFIVDKWGNIYEGRANSLTSPVIGVHAGGFNTGTVGVAMLGTYSAAPSAATQQAVGRIIGWRLGQYGLDPRGWMSYYTGAGQNSRYQNRTVSLPRVFGHRDVSYTACPGDGGHASLDNIRAHAYANSNVESMPRADAEALVKAMYTDLLGRSPEAGGLSTWSDALVRGRSTVDVATSITRSEEFNRRRIAAAYSQVLGRSPDAPGVETWLRQINSGAIQVDNIANNLVASDEFYLQSGRTDAGMVRTLYQRLLGRSGSDSEIDYWTSRVPSLSRLGVVNSITGSREAAQRKVQLNYHTFLGRSPDRAGQATWTDALLAHGEAYVRNSLLGSTEYRMRAVARFPA